MRHPHAADVYRLFDAFVEEFLLSGNSILSDHPGILSRETLDNCFKRYEDNYDDSNEKFDKKIVGQFSGADHSTKLVFAHAEWLWAFGSTDITKNRKKSYVMRMVELPDNDLNEVFPRGFGSAGMYHTNNKYFEILFSLRSIDSVLKAFDLGIIGADIDSVKHWYESVCLYVKYNFIVDPSYESLLSTFQTDKQLALTNILLHVANPDRYERIASNNHKNRIISSFDSLLNESQNIDQLNPDEKILRIREELSKILNHREFDFYEDPFRLVWDYSLTTEGYDEIRGLQYKKAIILYGPPGTSKTHTARSLGEALITNQYLSDKSNVRKYFAREEDFSTERIHHLQLHPNYTYEDFVAGYQLQNGETVKTKGTLFRICEEAARDKEKIHVLILDEINRIDLSRLFGEVFSALENRGMSIEVGIGELELTIPENLYVIGTMNEIDFSLERIDFALRRRFLWFFYGYSETTLRSIIDQKNRELNARLKMEEEVERFISNATALNEKISSIPELGEQYQIGHTFFAEIVNIYLGFKEIGGYTRLQNQLYRTDGPTNILWGISIKPMIVSFLGNMDAESRDTILEELHHIYNQN